MSCRRPRRRMRLCGRCWIDRISREVDLERRSLHALIARRLPDFSQQCQDAVSLTLKLSSVQSHVEHNEREIERHAAKVQRVTSAHDALSQELSRYTALWSALSQLKAFREALDAVESLLRKRSFKGAVQALPSELQPEDWIRNLPQWKALESRQSETVALLKDRIRGALDECIQWQGPTKLLIQASTQGGSPYAACCSLNLL
jgi:hypothetical protein